MGYSYESRETWRSRRKVEIIKPLIIARAVYLASVVVQKILLMLGWGGQWSLTRGMIGISSVMGESLDLMQEVRFMISS